MKKPEENTDEPIEAAVGDIVGEGAKRYAVTYTQRRTRELPKGTCITFTMSGWSETTEPKEGQVVQLLHVEKFSKGWRAQEARSIRA